MGSFGDGNWSKDENPALNWVRDGINSFNDTCRRRAATAPWWIRVLAHLGIHQPSYQWQQDHWYDFDRPRKLRYSYVRRQLERSRKGTSIT